MSKFRQNNLQNSFCLSVAIELCEEEVILLIPPV